MAADSERIGAPGRARIGPTDRGAVGTPESESIRAPDEIITGSRHKRSRHKRSGHTESGHTGSDSGSTATRGRGIGTLELEVGHVTVGPGRAARAWLRATVGLTVGSFLAAVLLAPPASARPISGLAWLLLLGSSVHVAATGWLYTVPDVRAHIRLHPARYVWVPVALVVSSAALAVVLPPSAFSWVLLPYIGWQLFHFQKQNVGMAALAAASCRIRGLRPTERRAIVATGLAGFAGVVSHPGLAGLTAEPAIQMLYWPAAAVFTLAVLAGFTGVLLRPRDNRPAGFCAVYFSSLLFALPVFVFSSPYAAVGGMIIAHGFQYLLLVGLVAAGGRTGKPRMLQIALLLNVALLGGLGLAAASHLHNADTLGRLVYGSYLGFAMSHFVVDAGLWRLRDEFPRRFLTQRIPFLLGRSGK